MLEVIEVHEPLAAIADQLVYTSLYASRILLPILLLIVLGFFIIRSLIAGETLRLDFGPILRGLVLMLIISVYPELMQVLSMALSGFTSLFNVEDEKLAEIFGNLAVQAAGTGEESGGVLGAVSGYFSDVLDGVRSVGWSLGAWIQEGLIYAVRGGISLVRSFLLVFLFLIGPIALAFSLIPGFQHTALSWLKGFMGVSLWALTLNILDMLAGAFNEYALQLIAQGEEFSLSYGIMVNVVIALVYLLTPALTNYFISTGGPAALLGQVMTVGAATIMAGGMAARVGGRMTHRSREIYRRRRENTSGFNFNNQER